MGLAAAAAIRLPAGWIRKNGLERAVSPFS